jgi:hypothetical protein
MAEHPLHVVRAHQERELAIEFALASMEHSLANEAFHVAVTLREAGVKVDPLTFVALRILEACVDEEVDPMVFIGMLVEAGSLARSVDIATDLLDRDAA